VQRPWAVALALVAVAAGCGGTKTVVKTRTVTLEPPRDTAFFGHIESLTRKGDHFVMRFDPAWFLGGETANRAAAADGAVEPGEPVPNDYYIVDEGHRLLTYRVPGNARVLVLTRAVHPERITVAELARIVRGTSGMRLFEPLDSGVWITVRIDTVRRIEQQYRP
jgi:hypothetical protein